ncbi:MAG TPA: aldo/keto reductase [Bacteroidales bacterium]|nr:aldo/keto reductase [Bacteroidales bacterium]
MNLSSRRKFLKNATGLVATGLVANSTLGNTVQQLKPADEKKEMLFRTLGRTGVKIPIVSMGVMNSSNPNLLKVAWQMGMRHFDTAWIYQAGNNEKMVGSVLKELNVDRKEVVITTKIVIDEILKKPENGAERKKQLLSRFEQSLTRLQMDYVDILMLHDVSRMEEVLDPYIMEAMQELKDQGKIRFPAFSTHVYWPELLTAAADKGFYDVALISFNYSMANDEASLNAMKYAASRGTGLVAMKTQCQQDWYKQNLPAETQKYYEGTLMHSALLKWVLHHDLITTAVPGFTTFEQLQADAAVVYDLEYSSDEVKFLEDHNVKLALQAVCRFCGGCRETCPHGVDIPSLMRTHMYAASYGNMHMTKSTLTGIEKDRGLAVCDECGECVARCRNSVQIAQRLEELQVMMG